MNDEMKQAWLEIGQMLGEPTREELDVFLRTWQRAIQAERKVLLDTIDELTGMERERHAMFSEGYDYALQNIEQFIRARGQA
jgi:hypothetical protein